MTVEEALIQLCVGTAGISGGSQAALAALVGNRVYLDEGLQGGSSPRIVLTCISDPGNDAHDGASGVASPRFQCDCIAPVASQAIALKEVLRQNLDGFRGTVPNAANTDSLNVQAILKEDGSGRVYPQPGVAGNLEFGVRLDFTVWYQEP